MSKETATTSTSANKRPTLLQLKISLAGTYPPIWRRIQIPWDFSFEDLHDTIIDTMGWLHAGEHYFEMKNQQNASIKIGPKSEEEDQENVNPQEEQNDMKAEDVETLRDYFTKENNMCHYYLSGSENSSWLHTIKLEKMVNSRVNVEYPRVIAGSYLLYIINIAHRILNNFFYFDSQNGNINNFKINK